MDALPSYHEELAAFERRLHARRAAEKHAPWHPRHVLRHPARTFRLAFRLGLTGDDLEYVLAHMNDSGTAGSKDKPGRPKPGK